MISAVVLAAGLSTRMGRQKLVLRVGGKPVLQRVLDALRQAKIDETVVVLGADAAQLKRSVTFEGARPLVNRDYAKGMSSSLKLGLDSVSRDSEAAIIVLGDQPLLAASTIDAIVEGYMKSRAPIVVPVYRRVRGNPVLLARSVFPEVMKTRGDVGAKSVVKAYGDRVLEIPVRDAGVLIDIDTPSDYERATSHTLRTRQKRTQGAA